MDLISVVSRLPETSRTTAALRAGRRVLARGSVGSSASFFAAALARAAGTGTPMLLVTAHADEADETIDELGAAGLPSVRFPALEVLPGESAVSLELLAERLAVVRRLVAKGGVADDLFLVAPIHALMQAVPTPERLGDFSLALTRGQGIGPAAVVRWLDASGYRRSDSVREPGEFAVRGGILDVFAPGALVSVAGGEAESRELTAAPVRLDFFGDEIERLSEIDPDTMGSDRALQRVELVCARTDLLTRDTGAASLLDYLPERSWVALRETLEITEQARGYYERVLDARGVYGPPAVFRRLNERFPSIVEINQFSTGMMTPAAPDQLGGGGAGEFVELPVAALPTLARDAGEAVAELASMARGRDGAAARRVVVYVQNAGERARLGELLSGAGVAGADRIGAAVSYVHRGFIIDSTDGGLAAVPYHELLHRFETRRRFARLRARSASDSFLGIEVGDFVVHAEHGIARFTGLRLMRPREAMRSRPAMPSDARAAQASATPDGEVEEYLTLEFAAGAKLHVPATRIDQVQRYVGAPKGKPTLSTLGGKRWQNQKQAVAESVRGLAAELLRVRAARESLPGIAYPSDTPWLKEFEDEFPYEETPDQSAAMAEIKRDMHGARPMDRLVCGDVGFGKTELAIRAAFKACEAGRQAAVLVPTTVLAEQHERTFRSRFASYPFRVESLSRFKSDAEARRVLEDAAAGKVDVLIGTHRLLSADVRLPELGLVVVDEEQRFGVEHKERLLAMRLTADVLTLTATPIPRTLHMSMLGLRDISSLTTPPMDRRAVVTEVIPYNERRIGAAIARELSRDGQVFFVHNRIHNIRTVADDVQRLAPGARIVIGHGQMPPKELEAVMLAFMRRQADILVSTNIIESGIDIPTANTIFINDADRFGLADLHQLRGRVGRYKHRAYCYLLLPKTRHVTEIARKRLKALEEFSMLGAGFKIAMRDLEIRGAGNILGPEQSGHIAAVGYDMYCRLLERAVKELRHEPVAVSSDVSIEIGVSGLIPKPYIPSESRRLEAYRRFAAAASIEELQRAESDLVQAYGPPPEPVSRLIQLAQIKVAARAMHVRSISIRGADVFVRASPPDAVAQRLRRAKGTVRVLPGEKKDDPGEVYYRPPGNYLNPATLLVLLRRHLVDGPVETASRSATGPSARPPRS
ncbi:MAG: transcription-repair coupling factor [Phycisphaerae bacterium]|nr:transcription-repair coupling factor [Phycisphaerae bacterium]